MSDLDPNPFTIDRTRARPDRTLARRSRRALWIALLLSSLVMTSSGCIVFDLIFGQTAPEVPDDHMDPLGNDESADEITRCPVTGEVVRPDTAIAYVHNGKTYYFYDEAALEKFKRQPSRYTKS